MRKSVFAIVALSCLSFSSFAATCTRTGNGYKAVAKCNCSTEKACAYAQQAIDAMK